MNDYLKRFARLTEEDRDGNMDHEKVGTPGDSRGLRESVRTEADGEEPPVPLSQGPDTPWAANPEAWPDPKREPEAGLGDALLVILSNLERAARQSGKEDEKFRRTMKQLMNMADAEVDDAEVVRIMRLATDAYSEVMGDRSWWDHGSNPPGRVDRTMPEDDDFLDESVTEAAGSVWLAEIPDVGGMHGTGASICAVGTSQSQVIRLCRQRYKEWHAKNSDNIGPGRPLGIADWSELVEWFGAWADQVPVGSVILTEKSFADGAGGDGKWTTP